MAQGRSTKIISMIKWMRTSRLSMKNYLSLEFRVWGLGFKVQGSGCTARAEESGGACSALSTVRAGIPLGLRVEGVSEGLRVEGRGLRVEG